MGMAGPAYYTADMVRASAFKWDRALDEYGQGIYEDEAHRDFRFELPPGTNAELTAQAQALVDAVGDGWKVMPDCGCKVNGAWVGTVTGIWNLRLGEMGVAVESSTATVRLEIDTSYAPEDTVR
jgi:hypothetical protein